MSSTNTDNVLSSRSSSQSAGVALSLEGVSPYSTGGGGVTFERKVAVEYLAHMLVGDTAPELGNGRIVVSVGFQQAPYHPVDDLLVYAAHSDETAPSLMLALAVRRLPNFVASDESTLKLIQQFVSTTKDVSTDGPEYRLGLVVSGPQPHAQQLAELAHLAMNQKCAADFFNLIRTPSKFRINIRERLEHLEKLVQHALEDPGEVEVDAPYIQMRTWDLLSKLTVRMPRLEPTDETDWSAVENNLRHIVPDADPSKASQLRDRLVSLAADYAPAAAQVNLSMLRRDTYALLDTTIRRHRNGWQVLRTLHQQACGSVRAEIKSGNDNRSMCLDRNAEIKDLLEAVSNANTVVVSGESGVGKSALAVLGLTAVAEANPKGLQVLCMNLRHIPRLAMELETALGQQLSILLGELGAPQRILVIDGADAIVEDRNDIFRHLVDVAKRADVKVIAATSSDSKEVVRETLKDSFGNDTAEYVVPMLNDSEIDEIAETFTELAPLAANPRSRELLRRLVVVDLLVRGRVLGTPLTDADAMNEVWSGLVKHPGMPDRGFPDAREVALLQLGKQELFGGNRLKAIREIDPAALNGLRRDGLLRTPPDDPFMIGPEFAHDEVRRYAVARLLLSHAVLVSMLMEAEAPRWSLAASRLACQAFLALPDTTTTPLKGRFITLQKSFDALSTKYGSRWSDVPGEAVLKLTNAETLLRDAWPNLLDDDSAGLRRLARLIDQRLRNEHGVVDMIAVEPIIRILLEAPAPWRSGEHVQSLLRDWLHGHVIAKTGPEHPLRLKLRRSLVAACTVSDQCLVENRTAAAKLTPEKILLELLALLGPDLGDEGATILSRVARDSPSSIGPVVDDFFIGLALAKSRRGLLGELIEAYYIDEEIPDGPWLLHDGIRPHCRGGIYTPQAAWDRGSFWCMFQSDFPEGVRILNRLLNHAARVRTRMLTDLGRGRVSKEFDTASLYRTQLKLTGAHRPYIGDEHVWRWYRGTGVGPDPCISALQALERVCDQIIKKNDIPIGRLVAILMEGCENLAVPGLIVGLLVRHLEDASVFLDPYFTEPFVWRLEFARVVHESGMFATQSEGLVAPERRNWSLRESAMFMGLSADEERIAEIRVLGETLVSNACRLGGSVYDSGSPETESPTGNTESQLVMQARMWASSLDRDRYEIQKMEEGVRIWARPPTEVMQSLQENHKDMELTNEATRLRVRYSIDPTKEHAGPISTDELIADMKSALELLESSSSFTLHNPWDISAMVAAAVLEAYLLDGSALQDETLSTAAEIVLQIGEFQASPGEFEIESTFYEDGADRSAARVLPLLLLPCAIQLRVVLDGQDGRTAFERATRACNNLAHAVALEVKLNLARGLDQVWKTPCLENSCCHHEIGWRIITETMRHCVLGARNPDTGQRNILELNEPFAESLDSADDNSILVSRLDAAIRACAPATMADICISPRAGSLLLALFDAQRRSLLIQQDHNLDDRGSHSLVTARALLTLARDSDDTAIYKQIDAFADNATLLYKLLTALSAAAEETPTQAATAKRLWPNVIRHVLQLNRSGHTPFQGRFYGDLALGSLIPNATGKISFLYREVRGKPIIWWSPLELKSEVEEWLVPAAGNKECVDRLIDFIRGLEPDEQVRVGLPWIVKLVGANPNRIANRTFYLETWLIDIRSCAVDANLLHLWQQLVDELVVAGATRLAQYSD